MRTLRGRFIFSHLLPIALVLPLTGVLLVYLLETQIILADATNDLVAQAGLIGRVADQRPAVWSDPRAAAILVAELRPRADTRLDLRRPDGQLLASSDPDRGVSQISLPNLPVGGALRSSAPWVRVSGGLLDQALVVLLPIAGRDQQLVGIVELTQTFAGIGSRIWRARMLVLGLTATELLIGVLVGVLLALRLARPIERAATVMTLIADGGRPQPLEAAGPAELRRLSESVNALAARLRALEEQRRRSLANIVHELGRPLGAMRAAVHVLGQRAGDDAATRHELLMGIEQAITGMQPLLDDLALLHGQVQGTLQVRRKPIDLHAWLPSQLATWQAAALEKGLAWHSVLDSQLPVLYADPEQLGRAVGNLLSNAVKYTPAGGAVDVTARTCGEAVCIEVADTGLGIPSEEQSLIFEPFFRSERQRRFPQGLGLGLTIAREIITAHQGHLDLSSVPGEGSRFSITLPRPSSPAKATAS
jgi:signal transduction histidine kinase